METRNGTLDCGIICKDWYVHELAIDAGDSLLKQSEKIERALNIGLQGALMKQNTKHSYGI